MAVAAFQDAAFDYTRNFAFVEASETLNAHSRYTSCFFQSLKKLEADEKTDSDMACEVSSSIARNCY